LRNWSRKFALGFGTISLLGWGTAAAQAPRKSPVIALVDSGDLAQWETWTKDVGWLVIAPSVEANSPIDTRIQALQKAVTGAIQNGSADPARIYLAGRGEGASAVFYIAARIPDLWAAAVAVGGTPQAAIDSGRLYTANFSNVPFLWVGAGAGDSSLAETLRSAGMMLDSRPAAGFTAGGLFDWLRPHTRPEFPESVDCETDAPAFASCYWIRMTKFDSTERNDVLASTRVPPSVSGALDLGGFGFKKDEPGPGVLVGYLPEKYSGRLKLGDRIVELDGREIPDARRYVEMMAQVSAERPAVATVQRGKERMRIETRIVLPQRPPGVTARVRARYLPEEREVEIVSRIVTEMRVEIPPAWAPAILNWNGVPVEKVDQGGCRLLTVEKEIQKAGDCR
jgi:pimeloyl-ACP methyl ester carboxylesterase